MALSNSFWVVVQIIARPAQDTQLASKYNSDEYVRVALIRRAVVVGARRRAVKCPSAMA
jgi:hypothetical protein